jgi:hypothetical protein
MDLMYLSTLDLPGSLISESRTSTPSSSQVSWLYQHILTLYTVIPHTYSPYTQPAHVYLQCICTLYTDNPCMHRTMGFSINPIIFLSTLHATLGVCYFRCIHKYLQEVLHKKIDIQNVQVYFLLFISSCSLTLSLF